MLYAKITPRLSGRAGVRQGHQHAQGERPALGRLQPPATVLRITLGLFPVPRLDLLVILVLAAVCGAFTASATGHFEPLPLFAGVIVVGVVRSLKLARQRG